MSSDSISPELKSHCACFDDPSCRLRRTKDLGMDSNFAEITVQVCRQCQQYWLRYFYEHEAYTASGRWYRGAITAEQLASVTVENAKKMLEELDWYYYGGSYFSKGDGKGSGKIYLYP
jgi:hypothetical protein